MRLKLATAPSLGPDPFVVDERGAYRPRNPDDEILFDYYLKELQVTGGNWPGLLQNLHLQGILWTNSKESGEVLHLATIVFRNQYATQSFFGFGPTYRVIFPENRYERDYDEELTILLRRAVGSVPHDGEW